MAEKVADLEALLELLEEDLDAPPRLIEFANAGGGPFGIVGDEYHDDFFAVNLDAHLDAAQGFWILVAAFRAFK